MKDLMEETMPKKEFQGVQLQNIQNTGGMRLALNTFAELEKFAHFMAISNFVPKHLRTKQADCLAVLLQSIRWEMDPFAVAQKTYFVNDGMGYEAQLVNAIIISRSPIKSRPKFQWSGEGEELTCTVSAIFIGEDEPSIFEAKIKTISTRHSPLWKQQPEQQLAYFALRAWARLYAPDIIMGVYTKEEREEIPVNIGADNAINITPQTSFINEILKKASEDAQKSESSKLQQIINAETVAITPLSEIKEVPQTVSAENAPAEKESLQVEQLAQSFVAQDVSVHMGEWNLFVDDYCKAAETATTKDHLAQLRSKNSTKVKNCAQNAPDEYKQLIDFLAVREQELTA